MELSRAVSTSQRLQEVRNGASIMAVQSLDRRMILPGLVSAAFFRRRPSTLQISLSLIFTVVASGLLGFWQDYGTSRVWENTALAIVGGVILYVAILAYLVLRYYPKHRSGAVPSSFPPSPPSS